MAGFAHAHGKAGQHAKARAILRELENASRNHYTPPVQLAFVHLGLGEHERALDLLESAYDQRSWELVLVQVEPWLEPLEKEARFQALKKRLKFPAPITSK
jgi:predicted nucleic acid-binding protein